MSVEEAAPKPNRPGGAQEACQAVSLIPTDPLQRPAAVAMATALHRPSRVAAPGRGVPRRERVHPPKDAWPPRRHSSVRRVRRGRRHDCRYAARACPYARRHAGRGGADRDRAPPLGHHADRRHLRKRRLLPVWPAGRGTLRDTHCPGRLPRPQGHARRPPARGAGAVGRDAAPARDRGSRRHGRPPGLGARPEQRCRVRVHGGRHRRPALGHPRRDPHAAARPAGAVRRRGEPLRRRRQPAFQRPRHRRFAAAGRLRPRFEHVRDQPFAHQPRRHRVRVAGRVRLLRERLRFHRGPRQHHHEVGHQRMGRGGVLLLPRPRPGRRHLRR